ncbi:MAG: hypothetical protein SPD11_05135, partial [Sphaerochaetaceae bacterium]|nr:hypothetical protein [Sphaerochaetaceae bacterium]
SKQSASSHQAVTKQSPSSHQAVTKQSPSSHQAVTKQSPLDDCLELYIPWNRSVLRIVTVKNEKGSLEKGEQVDMMILDGIR